MCELKARGLQLENSKRTLERKLSKLKSVKESTSVSSQTSSTIDTQYAVTESLPPIFGSKLCLKSKPIFMTKSVPNLFTMVQVEETEEDLLREAAEEALNYLYDTEVELFYEEARRKASRMRNSCSKGGLEEKEESC